MANDFKRKEPSKTEKVIYELFMQQQSMEQNLLTNSMFISVLAILANVKPEQIADMLVNKNEDIKNYAKQINEAIGKLEQEKKAAQPQGNGNNDNHSHDHGHNHGHDHVHNHDRDHNHDHDHDHNHNLGNNQPSGEPEKEE